MTDIAIDINDWSITLDGADLSSESGLRTATLISLLTDAQASSDDALPDGGDDRRGCWMDTYQGNRKSIGSRLWLLSREKELPDVLRRAREYATEALQWLIDDGVATAVTVTAEQAGRGVLLLSTTLTLPDGTQYSDAFNYPMVN